MNITFAKIGDESPIELACSELCHYLKKIDREIIIECRSYDKYDETVKGVIWLGTGIEIIGNENDGIYIKINGNEGIITGTNPRSVLIAAYRFLYELGCRFYRFGVEGADCSENEYIPKICLTESNFNICVAEKASYKHRSVCIEGSVSYEHVQAIINWLPKVGMNGYYVQFKVPHTFFNDWSEHKGNDLLNGKTLTRSDVLATYKKIIEDIKKRGLMLHAVGHGWTCEPLGVDGSGWYKTDMNLADDKKELLALIDGERKFYQDVPLNTNLCYSNKKVRDMMTDAIVSYCEENPAVDYLHFWLADSKNAQCECSECKKSRPSDYYVMMLNELDEKLTLKGIKTKIVFLIYYDLLWNSELEKIKNQDRFVLMFAPITRTYSTSFTDFDMKKVPEPPAYIRNNFTLPRAVNENLSFLKDWQRDFYGDSFDFDYHLMWDHVRDVGYYDVARILHKDMCNLDKIGLNGMVSCQVQRAAFPTNLPMYAMAKGLWDKSSNFEAIVEEYFSAEFDKDGIKVKEYLSLLSDLVDLPYFRRENTEVTPKLKLKLEKALELIEQFNKNVLMPNLEKSRSWYYLQQHAHMTQLVIYALLEKTADNMSGVDKYYEELARYAHENEMNIHRVLDVNNYLYVVKASLAKKI